MSRWIRYFFLAYLVGSIFTFFQVISTHECSPEPVRYRFCESTSVLDGYFASLVWPGHWVFVATHPKRPDPDAWMAYAHPVPSNIAESSPD